MREKQKKGNGSVVGDIVLIVAVLVFLFSVYKLYTIYSEYRKGEKEYEEVIDQVIVLEEVDVKEEETDEKGKLEEKEIFTVDFEKLQKMNKEAVAWLRFENPKKISYPVVQAEDNSKYLKRTFEGKTNTAGTLFVDAYNDGDFSDRNTFIYGHNMKNGSMFGQLRKYKSAEFCKENPYFYVYMPDGKEVKYEIFAVGIVEDTDKSYNKFFENDEEYEEYLKHIQKVSRYHGEREITAQSQIVSLSTCTNVTETQRLLVHGVKISETAMGE